MKKSKFLQNPKDMLSRSFNPAKCKTSLRLAGSRLKLLRNKKEVQVKQMRREIAQLLESGQDRTARIRVEHVIREEKMMAAYDLMEIYCELVVARLPIIESQKNCPIDLKEAIASVIFATPRCGDIPELVDVKKQFTAKYGKDFATAALDLRPACGVGRMLVEKLSAVAPDGQTKFKILSAIAEEHNVKWEPTEEKDTEPANDLLGGPSTFGKESGVYVEPSHSVSSYVETSPGNNRLGSSQLKFAEEDHRNSLGKENLISTQTSSVSTTFQPEERPLGNERPRLYQGDSNPIPLDRQRWHMEFKDAASAAQAAAESADRATMAARAAAEFSSGMRHYSTDSHSQGLNVSKDKAPELYKDSKLTRKQYSEELLDRASSGYPSSQNVEVNSMKAAEKLKEASSVGGNVSHSSSSKSRSAIGDVLVNHGVTVRDGNSRKNSIKEDTRGEMSTGKPSFNYEDGSETGWPEKSEEIREERIGEHPSIDSSHSRSNVPDDVNIFSNYTDQKFGYDAGEDPSIDASKVHVHGEASPRSSHEAASVAFDDYDSDGDSHRFDIAPTYDDQDSKFNFPSTTQKFPEHLSVNKVKSPTSPFVSRKNSSPDFSENLTSLDVPELDTFIPATFDDSDGPTSESDQDNNVPTTRAVVRDSTNVHNGSQKLGSNSFATKPEQSVGSPEEELYSGYDRKHLSPSPNDVHSKRNYENNFDADSYEKSDLDSSSGGLPDLGLKKSQVEPYDSGKKYSPDSGEGLNFGRLTGGLRHKGYKQPPYLKKHKDGTSLSREEIKFGSATVESPMITTTSDHRNSSRAQHCSSDSDSSEEGESLQKNSDHKPELFRRREEEVKTKSSLGFPNPIFGSDNSDLDDEVPKESLSRKIHLQSGVSRRTKPSPARGAKSQAGSEAVDFGAHVGNKPSASNTSETQRESISQRRKSNQLENSERPTLAKVAHKPTNGSQLRTPEQPNSEKESSSTMHESERSWKSSAVERPSRIQPKMEASVSNQKPHETTEKETSSNKDKITKKASHVHPKLPDYDSLVQSLRMNRS